MKKPRNGVGGKDARASSRLDGVSPLSLVDRERRYGGAVRFDVGMLVAGQGGWTRNWGAEKSVGDEVEKLPSAERRGPLPGGRVGAAEGEAPNPGGSGWLWVEGGHVQKPVKARNEGIGPAFSRSPPVREKNLTGP